MHCAQKFHAIQPVTCVDLNLSFYDMIEWPEGQKCTQLIFYEMRKLIVIHDVAQEMSTYSSASSRNHRIQRNKWRKSNEAYNIIIYS